MATQRTQPEQRPELTFAEEMTQILIKYLRGRLQREQQQQQAVTSPSPVPMVRPPTTSCTEQ